jgi:TolB-like protein/tRNA A-37 threonylcarbamoyl transferase component Bud32
VSELLAELRDALPERYRVDRQIGQGGMATVFVAEDTRYGRKVAVKVLNPDLASTLGAERFEREIQILGKLNHPHILSVLDSGESHGLLYYVMPFVEGESLRDRLNRDGQLPIDEAIAITCDVADALSHAHSLGIIHRDIKPENILIHGGHAVVADFGIARMAPESGVNVTKLTGTGMSLGTATYMSPEQALGEKVDYRSDIYSLACMLYELLAGEPPFTGPNAMAVMARHTMEMPRSIRVVRQSVPPEIEETVLHALEKAPVDRFKTMDEFKRSLLGQGGTVTAWRVTRTMASRGIATNPGTRRRRTLIYGIAAIALLTAGGLAAQYYRTSHAHVVASSAGDVAPSNIAVLYLDVANKDSSLRHIADGLTEALIDQLSQTEGLHVVSAGGVSPFRNIDAPKDSIARALKVGTIVSGAIERDGNQLQLSVRLIDGQSGVDYSRASFRVGEGEFLHARDSLSASVAELLRKRLGDEVRLRELRAGTSNAEAWGLVQRAENVKKSAEQSFNSGDVQGAARRLAEADSLAARASMLDVHWAEPLVERGDVAFRRTRLTKDQKEISGLITTGLDYASRAVDLDPRSSRALELRGILSYYRIQAGLVPDQVEAGHIVDSAERDLRVAVSINPRQATAWNALSVLEYGPGRKNVVEANLDARRAYESDAFVRAAPSILYRLWATSYDLEQFPDAIHWCTEGQRRFPNDPRFVQCRLYLMLTKAVDPDPDQAWRLVGELQKTTPRQEWELSRREAQILVSIVLDRAKLADSAHHVLAASRAGSDIDPRGELLGLEALAHTFFGERAEAISTLERYLTNHPDHRAGFGKVNAWWWRDLQEDPRFKTLAATGR